MEKSLDESCGNEERGRAQGTDVGERARCRPVEGTRGCRKRWSTASTLRPVSSQGPRAALVTRRLPFRGRARRWGASLSGGEWARAAGLTTS